MKIKITLLLSAIVFVIASCSNQENETSSSEGDEAKVELTLEKAKEYAMATQNILGKNLMHALGTKGAWGAIEFCGKKALFLTDSSAKNLKVSIKRVSDKPRNPENKVNKVELQIIQAYKNQLAEGLKLEPQKFTDTDGAVSYNIPILTNAMCLNCHGNEEIAENTTEKLQELYPEDKATGYNDNELRGLWVIKSL